MFEYVQERDLGRKLEPRTMVYVITHGEPSRKNGNKLSDTGEEQVKELAASRVATGVRTLYSSTEKCSLSTAGLLRKEFGAKVETVDSLAGITESDFMERAKVIEALMEDPSSPQSGVSIDEMMDWIANETNKIGAKNVGDVVALVVPPLVAVIIHSLVTGGIPTFENWLLMGFASCASYEYTKKGWTLVMPPDNSFLTNMMSVEEYISKES